MAGTVGGAHTAPRDQIVFAIILILVGVAGLVLNLVRPAPDLGGLIVLAIGVGLLGAFAFTRQYGYLVPGGIMTGLGAGIIAAELLALPADTAQGGAITLGLGLGFVAIWVIGGVAHVAPHHWWPLIPGAILATVGVALLIGDAAVGLLEYWGIAIVAIGLIVLWRAWTQSRPSA